MIIKEKRERKISVKFYFNLITMIFHLLEENKEKQFIDD